METKIVLTALIIANLGLVASYLTWGDTSQVSSGMLLFTISCGLVFGVASIAALVILAFSTPLTNLLGFVLGGLAAITGLLNLLTFLAVIAESEDRLGRLGGE